ncbi:Uncharacterised protein [uncultured Clostridium sp.]|nr:Uncharacterised protein [uncultured Clostridium sp.]
MRYVYFAVEGAHDAAAIGKILRLEGFWHHRRAKELPPAFRSMIPTRFPFWGDDLEADAPIPYFYTRGELGVAVRMAGGIGRICQTIDDDFYAMQQRYVRQYRGIGVVIDADEMTAQEAREHFYRRLGYADARKQEREGEGLCFSRRLFDEGKQKVLDVSMRGGVYVLPDDAQSGTLEDLLISGGNIAFPEIVGAARDYMDKVGKRLGSQPPSHLNKALVGCVGNVFNPGKANQISIYRDAWISPQTREGSPAVDGFYRFIMEFLERAQ